MQQFWDESDKKEDVSSEKPWVGSASENQWPKVGNKEAEDANVQMTWKSSVRIKGKRLKKTPAMRLKIWLNQKENATRTYKKCINRI